jgi:hypothetical protein
MLPPGAVKNKGREGLGFLSGAQWKFSSVVEGGNKDEATKWGKISHAAGGNVRVSMCLAFLCHSFFFF